MKKNKKNWIVRFTSIALMFTLISTCLMSSTLAKYTTSVGGTDTARVATWGFGSDTTALNEAKTATLGLFNNTYSSDAGVTVKSVDDDKVVAPGTIGTLELKFTGSSEVTTKLTYDVNATYANPVDGKNIPLIYAIDADSDGTVEYYSDYYNAGDYHLAVPTASGTYSNQTITIVGTPASAMATKTTTIAPNALYSTANNSITWFWAYQEYTSSDYTVVKDTQDVIDTALGKAAYAVKAGNTVNESTAPNVILTITVTATQVD